MKSLLITGATGSLGTELVARYYTQYEIYAQGRDSQNLLKLKMRYPRVNLVLGDLRCHALHHAIRASSVVIHAAAQKYVDLAEQHCHYTVDTNVVCTHEIADLAGRSGVKHFIFVSTDKSSSPTNVYGATKYLAERLVLELSDIYGDTTFTICRFGNIFGSNGSVVQLWLEAMKRNAPHIQVTNPEMTRFMFSLDDASAAVQYALEKGKTGDIIIPKMRAVHLRDIMDLFEGMQVKVVGKRPGEKVHETLYVKNEINTGYETELYYVLNRSYAETLKLNDIDSSQVDRVDKDQLRKWFEKMKKRL